MGRDNRIRISAGVDRVKSITAPPEELDKWEDWKNELGMTRSKFVRCAVSAGVSKIDPPSFGDSYDDDKRSYRSEIKEAIRGDARDADDVVEAVLEDVADDVRAELQGMIDTGQVTMSVYDGLVIDSDDE
ncbi:hypothetical protein [Haloarcula amylolytica]|uniref:Uncharacterized protein n=1 Tax=Haloarcula amylolytica JCM 13557 TaxID=1227452 RepID=M0K8I5_9EURY|nr:hypothetical protein [Haloarcula amylolytica]EMA16155.1 hypothetical protein C442_18359 [Haloarcula amylolytica JCM 13557]